MRVPGQLPDAAMATVDVGLRLLGRDYYLLRSFLEHAPQELTAAISRALALRAARYAAVRVPAYRDYLRSRGVRPADITSLEQVPESDKPGYINQYPLAERCVDGRIPLVGTTIDESSGSTGRPYNWVRSKEERAEVRRMIGFFARYTFGDAPLVILNAFSMGAWATGLTSAIALEWNGLVKATGPDIAKILGTMQELGSGYQYLIVGYPPFLKLLLDRGDSQGFDWSTYEMHALMGGDANSEELRDYLLRRFRSAYSGYGATDVEIGLAAETYVCVRLRKLAAADPRLAQALFGESRRSPMIFQYNPLLHHIETNAAGELIFTVTRLATLSPKVRYNIHDEGGTIRFDDLDERLKANGYLWEDIVATGPGHVIKMPFLYVFGRKDFTISVMGANIYPQDIEAAIYSEPEIAARVRSFQLDVIEPSPGETRPRISIQLESTEPTPELQGRIASVLVGRLLAMNRDYQEATREYAELMQPVVELYRTGEGPFAGSENRIKFRYMPV